MSVKKSCLLGALGILIIYRSGLRKWTTPRVSRHDCVVMILQPSISLVDGGGYCYWQYQRHEIVIFMIWMIDYLKSWIQTT